MLNFAYWHFAKAEEGLCRANTINKLSLQVRIRNMKVENLQSVAVVTNLVIKRQINTNSTRVCVGSDWKERTWTV
jgi:hypothetical protein